MTRTTTRESFTRLAVILGTAQYNENGIATISREMVGEIQLTLKDAQAEIDALTAERDEARAQIAARKAELKGKARYNPIDQSTLKISVDAKSLKLTPETRQRISKFVEGVHRNAGVR